VILWHNLLSLADVETLQNKKYCIAEIGGDFSIFVIKPGETLLL